MPTSFHSLKKRGEAIGKSDGLSGARVSRKHPSSAFVRRGQALGFPPHDSVSLPCVGRCSSPSGALRQQALARMLQVTSKSQCKIGQSYSSNRCRAMDPVWKAGSQQRCGAVFPQGEFWSCRPRAAEISVIIRHSSGSQCESVDVKVEVSFPLLSEGRVARTHLLLRGALPTCHPAMAGHLWCPWTSESSSILFLPLSNPL